jgi:aspartyl-tRNA(Asn)/glutamyl-tRNA(Gln) amidotransferase subunit C
MITSKDVEHAAKLARLSLSEDEKHRFADQLSRILDYFQELNSVATDGVEPLAHALPVVNVMREDEPAEPPGWKQVLASAPDSEVNDMGAFFRVPRIK